MKKKILAILSAAVLGCCALTAPAFAEETAAPETEQTYQLGDVDMDGEITAKDALLVLRACVKKLALRPCGLTEQQVQLSHISGKERADYLYVQDAQGILEYAVHKLAGYSEQELEIWFSDYLSKWDYNYLNLSGGRAIY